ncbi:SAM-dependent methyltransferase [Micromonospora sp. DR5-3]|uniref:SAM-dependent methyltransferase n=1 Tax=unclassified Micromonospora TaxID=2617518 RepID=UPI0011D7EFDB|nr:MULTISPECIES: SAM-dependent methyltransferase [unclassified Micromonospora]MCW3816931.1 SAM-dependent methyltransferase [Micromonospora sp. DR5-3]TYC23428.1 SAM-dependent methyltransferase [Micromonospora sp. MP36]
MTTLLPPDFADWLRLREPADAAARSAELVDAVRRRLPAHRPVIVHDLGSGTGSMVRWLAPRLPGPQHWVLHERDADLRAHAAVDLIAAADGRPVTVRTCGSDITRLRAADLADAHLVTASALLDMLTAEEIERMAAACTGRPTLFAITVLGRVEFTPADPLDAEFAAAFNAHQRRTVDGRTLLGPDAVAATVAAFRRRGVDAQVRASPWRLGPDQAALTAEWLVGWLDAAVAERPELAGAAGSYRDRRLAEAATGRLRVVLHHADLLAG